MRILMYLLFCLLAYFVLTRPPKLAPNPNIEAEILAENRKMEAIFKSGKFAQIGTFYAEDGVMVGNHVEVIGRPALTDYWSKFSSAHRWQLENIEIESLGENSALQRGLSRIYYYDGAEEKESLSIFTLIWIKTDEGWKIRVDHFSKKR
ncbi:MAG: nuclear transport factor 2 family protein [Saprospiraceae bacterium]